MTSLLKKRVYDMTNKHDLFERIYNIENLFYAWKKAKYIYDTDMDFMYDIKELAEYVLAHRMIIYSGRDIASKRRLIREILGSIEVPSEEWRRR